MFCLHDVTDTNGYMCKYCYAPMNIIHNPQHLYLEIHHGIHQFNLPYEEVNKAETTGDWGAVELWLALIH